MAVFSDLGTSLSVFNDLNLIITAGRIAYVPDDWEMENFTSPFSRMYYVKEGSGTVIINGREYELCPNNIYIIPVGTTYTTHLNTFLDKAYFHFNIIEPNGYDFLRSLRKMLILPSTRLHIDKIYKLIESPKLSDTLMLKSIILYDIMKMISNESDIESEHQEYSEKTLRAMEIISSAPSIQMNVKDIAAELFISESYLMKKFKEELGIPISNYIDEMVMYNAQIALVETDDPISVISERFGFTDKFYFSKRFKQLCGQTPTQYRKQHNIYK